MTAAVTVVIPARNAAATIAATLHSIIEQSTGRPRIIVVDDASEDATRAVARQADSAVVVVAGSGRGPGAARNTGADLVTTPYVAFCDADDLWPSDRVERDLESMVADASIDILLGRTRHDPDRPELLAGMVFDNPGRAALIPHFGAATMRTEAFRRVGPLDEQLTNYEDYEWFLRAREKRMGLVTHDRVALWRRVHEGSTSRVNPPSSSDLLAVLRQSLGRRPDGVRRSLPTLTDLRRGMPT